MKNQSLKLYKQKLNCCVAIAALMAVTGCTNILDGLDPSSSSSSNLVASKAASEDTSSGEEVAQEDNSSNGDNNSNDDDSGPGTVEVGDSGTGTDLNGNIVVAEVVSVDEDSNSFVLAIGGTQYTFNSIDDENDVDDGDTSPSNVDFSTTNDAAIFTLRSFSNDGGPEEVIGFGTYVELLGVALGQNFNTSDGQVTNLIGAVRDLHEDTVTLPTDTTAIYRGDFVYLSLPESSTSGPETTSGDFRAEVDFANNSLNGSFKIDGTRIAELGTSTISGTTFSGDILDDNDADIGNLTGGFYGPVGQEIAGHGNITMDGKENTLIVIGEEHSH